MLRFCFLLLLPLAINAQQRPFIVVTDHDRPSLQREFQAQRRFSHALHGFSAALTDEQAEQLRHRSGVRYVEPDGQAHLCSQTVQPGITRIGAPQNPYFSAATNLNVAIIDTGVDVTSADLNVVTFLDFSGEGLADYNGHGTHVSGIAAARDNDIGVVGVAPGARITMLKAFNAGGTGDWSWILAALDWIAAHQTQVDVLNMSFGDYTRLQSLRDAITTLTNDGIVCVAAAGNDALDIYGIDGRLGTDDDFIPAAYPEVLSVTAMADDDGQAGGVGPVMDLGFGVMIADDTLTYFTNHSNGADPSVHVTSWGGAIDLAAPGTVIWSTWPAGLRQCPLCPPGLHPLSGTSMAAPHVVGVVALYIAEHGRPTNAAQVYALRQALIDRAQPQSLWRDVTGDRDCYAEPLVYAGAPSWPAPPPPPPHYAPAAPTNLQQLSRGGKGTVGWVELGWTDNANNETNFEIWRTRLRGGKLDPWALVHYSTPDSTVYKDYDANSLNVIYYYQIRAWNSIGYSAWSNTLISSP